MAAFNTAVAAIKGRAVNPQAGVGLKRQEECEEKSSHGSIRSVERT